MAASLGVASVIFKPEINANSLSDKAPFNCPKSDKIFCPDNFLNTSTPVISLKFLSPNPNPSTNF
jgi:hypothetical protein